MAVLALLIWTAVAFFTYVAVLSGPGAPSVAAPLIALFGLVVFFVAQRVAEKWLTKEDD